MEDTFFVSVQAPPCPRGVPPSAVRHSTQPKSAAAATTVSATGPASSSAAAAATTPGRSEQHSNREQWGVVERGRGGGSGGKQRSPSQVGNGCCGCCSGCCSRHHFKPRTGRPTAPGAASNKPTTAPDAATAATAATRRVRFTLLHSSFPTRRTDTPLASGIARAPPTRDSTAFGRVWRRRGGRPVGYNERTERDAITCSKQVSSRCSSRGCCRSRGRTKSTRNAAVTTTRSHPASTATCRRGCCGCGCQLRHAPVDAAPHRHAVVR